ncbi:lysophospholipid acyltransferase family protein [Salegentibacter sp. F188]|uniref:Lysophospholipid acyltransferase family protein n=1 Tax=Autumnicola patrickiae TaxID=3075591 RepID=A0ABU3E1A1_9FLAO|nr:lysophospholipid acyltransferase family protein [Salegentibacter sp. F188]MDT0689780.1 lysophospholipid acyltransferase family protein [Salegentibacter sp. F188]
MQALVFWLVYPLLWIISILPFRLFYAVSDAVFFLVYHIIGYRKKVVEENLKLVFPEKSEEERLRIRKKFYSHMCDMFLEMIKTLTISEKELRKRFKFTNPEEVLRLQDNDKSIMMMCGHYASYEWMIALQLYGLKITAYGIYKKIKNPHFDKLVRDIRGRFKGKLISTTKATMTITKHESENKRAIYAMVADQSPKLIKSKYWADFMNIKAPVFVGAEKLAREFDMAVLYLNVEKVSRGHYVATLINITDSAAQEPAHKVTRTYLDLLETQIRQKPEFYLWTHKRWKHSGNPIPEGAQIID